MSTFTDLVDSTLLDLYGFSTAQDSATALVSAIDTDDVTFSVTDSTALSRGVIEIGSELMWVDSVSAGVVTVAPYGRGYRGTTAASHAAGSRVVSQPMIPRVKVQQAVNEAISGVYPDLWAVGTTTFTYVAGTYSYALPAGAEDVLSVTWQDAGVQSEWYPVRRYEVNPYADTTTFVSGVSITVRDNVVPGRTVRVTYRKQPSELVNDSDVFATVTGLPASCEDLIRLGAATRLVPFLDIPHLSATSAEADFSGQQRPVGNTVNVSKWLLQNYQYRLAQEASRLQDQYPVRVRYTF